MVFKQLGMSSTAAIAKLLMQETRERIALRGIGLEPSPGLMRFICQEGYSQVQTCCATAECVVPCSSNWSALYFHVWNWPCSRPEQIPCVYG